VKENKENKENKDNLLKPLEAFLKNNYPVSAETIDVCLRLVWRDCKYRELIADIKKFTSDEDSKILVETMLDPY